MRTVLGFEARALTPGVTFRVIHGAAETRSFERASVVLRKVGDVTISDDTIQRVVGRIGAELSERRDANPKTADALAICPEEPPALAVVECDGGRIRARQPGNGRGVRLSGEKGWRETKNACLVKATSKTFDEDPQPEPPVSFTNPKRVAKIVETETLSVAAPPSTTAPEEFPRDDEDDQQETNSEDDWRPKRQVRTVVSSMQCSQDFGRRMQGEAKRRRFYEASEKAFLGDGLPWNWSIWKDRFADFVPILDFIHPLSYLFLSAKAVFPSSEPDAWSQYLVWMRGCWQGEVGQVLDELRAWGEKLGPPPDDVLEQDPRKVVATTITYLENNRDRMKYPQYRRAGLPVTTVWMESLIKEINYRVKGTEMFWNDPEGAEAILQIRAAALSDDDRLSRHLRERPGCPFTRPPKPRKLPSESCKS